MPEVRRRTLADQLGVGADRTRVGTSRGEGIVSGFARLAAQSRQERPAAGRMVAGQVWVASDSVAPSNPTSVAVECVPAGSSGVWIVSAHVDGTLGPSDTLHAGYLDVRLRGYPVPGGTWGVVESWPAIAYGTTAEIPIVGPSVDEMFANAHPTWWVVGGADACTITATYTNSSYLPIIDALTISTRAVRIA